MTRQTTRMFTAALVFATTAMFSLVLPTEGLAADEAEATIDSPAHNEQAPTVVTRALPGPDAL